MREILERLLQSVDVPNPERAQLHWDEYRTGAGSSDPAVKAAADAAFATLLAWYGAALYRHIWGFIRTDAAEDVFQDVLRKLHEKRLSSRLADFHANVLPWLRTVAIRECVDAHRRAARRRSRETRAARPENEPRSENQNELQEALACGLSRLSREEQRAIALHYFEGLDKQSTAAALGLNRDTLATRLSSALTRLQKLVPVPAGILVGGTVAAPAALTAHPPALTPTRLGELISGAWDKTTEAGWSIGRVAAVTMIGLTLCGAAAAAGWALTSESPQPEEVRSPPPSVNEPRESLQARNLRILDRDIIPVVLDGLRGLALPNNPWRVDERRAEGSQVWVTFRRTHPLQNDTRDAIRVSYCVLTRRMRVTHFDNWQKRWKIVDLMNPVIKRVAVPFFGNSSVATLRAETARVRQAFDSLPTDDRAEQEQVRHLFGEHGWSGQNFTIPSTASHVFGNSRTLFVWMSATGCTFSLRVEGGGWRYAGIVEAWPLGVDETHFYYGDANKYFSRRIDDPQGSWERIGAMTPLFPSDAWLTTADRAHLKWRAGGEALPTPRLLAVWGNRLLHIPGEPGPIQCRSLSDPNTPWYETGYVHVPRE